MTRKDLLKLAHQLNATNIADVDKGESSSELRKYARTCIASCYGTYGCSGKIWQGDDGKFYYTPKRTQYVFLTM